VFVFNRNSDTRCVVLHFLNIIRNTQLHNALVSNSFSKAFESTERSLITALPCYLQSNDACSTEHVLRCVPASYSYMGIISSEWLLLTLMLLVSTYTVRISVTSRMDEHPTRYHEFRGNLKLLYADRRCSGVDV
jgi:hypothetical protein